MTNATEQFNELRDRLADDLADCIAPELNAAGYVDIAILTETSLGRSCDNQHGFTGPALRSLYRDILPDGYAAEGPAIFICDRTIEDEYTSPGVALVAMIAIAVHEVAHVVQWLANGDDCYLPVPEKLRRSLFKKMEYEPPAVHFLVDLQPVFPTGGHDLDFVRLAVHLASRMKARGWEIQWDRLWHPCVTGLSYGRTYAASLKQELIDAAELPLSAILRLAPTRDCVELYEENRRRSERVKAMSFLDLLKSKAQSKKASAAERYREYAIAVADGNPPSEDAILDTLRELGKSIDDFEAEVDRITSRRKLKAQADRAGEIREAMEDIEADFQRRQAEFLEQQRIFGERRDEYIRRRDELSRDLNGCDNARQLLRRSAPQELHDRIAEKHRDVAELESRISRVKESLQTVARHNLRAAVAESERNAHITDQGIRAEIESKLNYWRDEVVKREDQVRQLDADHSGLKTRLAQMEMELLHVD